jgi:hypothetical protein
VLSFRHTPNGPHGVTPGLLDSRQGFRCLQFGPSHPVLQRLRIILSFVSFGGRQIPEAVNTDQLCPYIPCEA